MWLINESVPANILYSGGGECGDVAAVVVATASGGVTADILDARAGDDDVHMVAVDAASRVGLGHCIV